MMQENDNDIAGIIFYNDMIYITPASATLSTKCELAASLPTNEDIYQFIINSENTLFDNHIKTAVFFMACLNTLKEKLYSQEIHDLLSEMKPISLRHDLTKILNKLGGYSFMPYDEKNITKGVEIEYSNIPEAYKKLTEWVMDKIQKGWSHPEDKSVEAIGENTYKGEATTPIIYDNTDLKHTMLNIAFLQAMGAATNASCGLHVHIGVKNLETPEVYKQIEYETNEHPSCTNYQLEFMKQFLMIYKNEAAKFMSIERDPNKYSATVFMPIERDPNTYSATVTIPWHIREIKTLYELIQQVNRNDRYYEVNFHAFAKHGTIEVRAFSGTTKEPIIYGTLAMIDAIAKEARTCTNIMFDKLITADEKKYDQPRTLVRQSFFNRRKTEQVLFIPGYKPPQPFFNRKKTEQQTELFMLRVKQIHESKVKVQPSAEQKNTVYVYLTQDHIIGYTFYDKKDKTKTGTIDDKRFENIIQKLKSHQSLDLQEKNQILLEVSMQSGALVSERVEKVKQTLIALGLPEKQAQWRYSA